MVNLAIRIWYILLIDYEKFGISTGKPIVC